LVTPLPFWSFSAFQLLPNGMGQMLVQTANFRKKFRSLANQHLRVLLKHAKCGGSRFKWVVSREGGEKAAGHRRRRTWSGTLHRRTGSGCSSNGKEAADQSRGPLGQRSLPLKSGFFDRSSAIFDPRTSIPLPLRVHSLSFAVLILPPQ
jgi:hypothetical protein